MNAESTTLVFNPELTADDWDRNPKFVTYPLIKYRKIIVKLTLVINAIIMYFTSLVFKNAFADSLKDSLSDKSLSKHWNKSYFPKKYINSTGMINPAV